MSINNFMNILYQRFKIFADIKKAVLGTAIKKNVNNEASGIQNRCLLIYITRPFCANTDIERHQNIWQSRELARIIGEYGYIVDVVDYDNRFVKLHNTYDLVIGLIPRGIDVYSNKLNINAKKIAYLTSSNLRFTEESEEKRIQELFQRKGVLLKVRRKAGRIQKEIEKFDAALFLGNEYNLSSYSEFNMPPVYFIKNNGYAFNFKIEHKKNPKKFIYFGSTGQVHKGLDLLLDIFSQDEFPCELYVCGYVKEERDFYNLYYKELNNKCNIHTLGFVDINSDMFIRLTNECAYSILPSCAEGQAGSVTAMMSAGVISIVSKECGFDSEDVVLLPDCKMETIRNYILIYSQKDQNWVEQESIKMLQKSKEKFSKECFVKSIREGLNSVLLD